MVVHSLVQMLLNPSHSILAHPMSSHQKVALSFTPSSKLKNLSGADEVESLAPLTDMLVGDLAREDTPQMYTLCGRGNQSTLRYGLLEYIAAALIGPGRKTFSLWCLKNEMLL